MLLLAIIDNYRGGPVGVETLAALTAEERSRREAEVRRFLTQFGGEFLVSPDLFLVRLERLEGPARDAPDAVVLLLQHSAEQAAVQRRPWQDPQAILLGGRDDLQFHVPGQQVVNRLLADQPVVVAAAGGFLGPGDVPAGATVTRY